jgi:hypothetical protein
MDTEQLLPSNQCLSGSTALATPDPKKMIGRIWSVAELLARAGNQMVTGDQVDQGSEKTQR